MTEYVTEPQGPGAEEATSRHPPGQGNQTYVQRMRITFATDDSVKYVGHLDMARAWERAIRRAALPLAYTQGFNPQPRLQFAAALAVGFTGEAELLDVYLDAELSPGAVLLALSAALPRGIRPLAAVPVAREWPSLQSQLVAARYRAEVETDETEATFAAHLDAFMTLAHAWRERRRGKDLVRYDLRPLVQSLLSRGPCERGQACEIVMRSAAGATGRPDELLAELGYEKTPRRVVRTELIFALPA